MAKYVYGIVRGNVAPPTGQGIAASPLDLVAGDGAAALVSDLPGDELQLGREHVLVHARVLEEALSLGTVLPMRVGVVMSGPDEVRDQLLEPHAAEFRAQLDRLDGKVELNVRAIYEEQTLMREAVRDDQDIARLRASLRGKPDDATYYGRIRLGELVAAAVERKRDVDSRELLDTLAPLALAVEVAEPAHERAVLSASFLVERRGLKEFDDAVERIARLQADRMRLKYTGPLPPHSFVELAGSA
jgi:Gas vesicle synthesis protein GvpL/GvpF